MYKKSKTDCSDLVHISVILNIDLAGKSIYVTLVDNDLYSKETILNHNRKATTCA